MAGILVLTLFITTSLSIIEAKTSKLSARRDGPVDVEAPESCVPGQFSRGSSCRKCFCNADKKKVCSPLGTCKLSGPGAEKALTTEQLVRIFNRVRLHLLPSLPSSEAKCTPGKSYRVDCNRCLCDQTRSLVCETLLCPSYEYDKINIRQAVKMTGKRCKEGSIKNIECLKCSCDDGKYDCDAIKDCIPTSALLKLQRGAKKVQRCFPGREYPNPNGGPPCTCTIYGMLTCPRIKKPSVTKMPLPAGHHNKPRGKMLAPRPGVALKEMLLDKELLDPNTKKECIPGVVYHNDCNRCTCSDQRVLRCTSMLCMKDTDVNDLVLTQAMRKKKIAKVNMRRKERCIPGKGYKKDCNSCSCDKNGELHCTTKACPKAKEGKEETRAD